MTARARREYVHGTCSDTCAVAGVRSAEGEWKRDSTGGCEVESFQPAATSRLGLANREILTHSVCLDSLEMMITFYQYARLGTSPHVR